MTADVPVVSGDIRLTEPLDASGGTLRVSVADVTRADAPARIVAGQTIALHDALAAGAQVPFAITMPGIEDGAAYIVQVHLDTTGSGTITPGDRITMQSYPVLTRGHPARLTIEARTV